MVVFKCVRVPIESMRDNNLFFPGVDLVHVAAEKVHAANHFADRINDVGQIQIARRDFVQHWREQEKVLAIYDRHFKPRIVALLEFQRSIKSAKAATENKHACLVGHNAELKNAPFKPEQLAERPCLERTAARRLRRFSIANFRYMAQSGMI